jgi:hypothetical protein
MVIGRCFAHDFSYRRLIVVFDAATECIGQQFLRHSIHEFVALAENHLPEASRAIEDCAVGQFAD